MKKQPFSTKPVTLIVCLLVIGALAVVGYLKHGRDQMTNLKTKVIPDVVQKMLNDPTVVVKEISGLKETSGVVEFELSLDFGGKIQKYTSYITKDGKLFFSAGTKVESLKSTANTEAPKKVTCDTVEKADKPLLTAFVVADCPYGLQMQRLFAKALGEQSEFGQMMNVRYMGAITDGKITSMHGDKEAQENLRQICIREEQKEKYWPYVSCYMKEGKSDACTQESGVDTAKLTSCVTDAKRGLAFAQKDFDLANKFAVESSPTLVVNDKDVVSEFDFGGRTVDALKSVVCCSSKTKPGFCDKTLSKDEVATSYSLTEAASEGAAGGQANCNTQ